MGDVYSMQGRRFIFPWGMQSKPMTPHDHKYGGVMDAGQTIPPVRLYMFSEACKIIV